MDSLSYKVKLMLLGFVIVALGLLSYKRAIRSTVELMGQYYELTADKQNQKDLMLELNTVKAELKEIEQYLGGQTSNVQHLILDEISEYCAQKRLHLSAVNDPIIEIENDLKTSTYELTIQGDFKRLLRLVHYLESDFKAAVLVSTEYYTTDNHKKEQHELYAKIYLQSIEKI